MKVTKKMVHKDLRSYYGVCNAIKFINGNKWSVKWLNAIEEHGKIVKCIKGLMCEEIYIPSREGDYKIRVRIYRPENHTEKLPCMLYYHGGGYAVGKPETSEIYFEHFIKTRPCVIVAPDYCKSFERPYPYAFNDCYDSLLYAKDHAKQLGIIGDQFMLAGHSAGGGLTAAVTLKARDTKDVKIAFQMPFYPMIDDTQPSDKSRYIRSPIWDSKTNAFGWKAYLADLNKTGADIPAYAAPARNSDYRDFPPTITFVGTLEPFYKETVAYVNALKKANVDVIFKTYPDCFHGFDILPFPKPIIEDAKRFTFESYAKFYDQYVLGSKEKDRK